MLNRRSSGILAHITSLPSPYGIGDLGFSSYRFIDFLAGSNQSYWQFLPTGPTNSIFDNSPYMSTSAFAGSFFLISPELLFEEGLIPRQTLDNHPAFSPYLTDYDAVKVYKEKILKEAFKRFSPERSVGYSDFVKKNSWLDDYALFMTAKEVYCNAGWFDWPRDLATRSKTTLDNFYDQNITRINYYRFEQFEFFRQWQLLKKYAANKNIMLFGDLPIYVSYDSVDVWANQQIFTLDRSTLRPTYISGVPPDYFSKTGQRWGNPLYDWQTSNLKTQEQLIDWWCDRFSHLFTLVDMARIDHFRGFESYWSIPEENETAINGKWLKGPGKKFFDKIEKRLGSLNIVAEDLGIITAEVEALRDKLNFPGMKVLQFAFDGNLDNSFLPHNFKSPHCIVYTGTHDNDTTVGWFLSDKLNDHQRAEIKLMANRAPYNHQGIHHDLIYLAQSSISLLSIFPLQDVLGFGNDCKMNSPGVPEGNWKWRCAEEFLSPEITQYLRVTTHRFNRGRDTEKDTV